MTWWRSVSMGVLLQGWQCIGRAAEVASSRCAPSLPITSPSVTQLSNTEHHVGKAAVKSAQNSA